MTLRPLSLSLRYEYNVSSECVGSSHDGSSHALFCANGTTPVEARYADAHCEGAATSTTPLAPCAASSSAQVAAACWQGGYIRNASVLVLLGALSLNQQLKELDLNEPRGANAIMYTSNLRAAMVAALPWPLLRCKGTMRFDLADDKPTLY